MASPVSPLAPKSYPELPVVAGVRFATAEAGIKYKNRTDVLLAAFDEGTTVAGVLTRSLCPSAAVDFCRANLPGGVARALLVNSGNANAFTGLKGRAAVELSADIVSAALGCAKDEIFLASTGVIGEPLPAEKFAGVADRLAANLAQGPWLEAAQAIMTTDTFPKVATATVEFDGRPVVISGIAKGSGMIAPDMATMLSFVFTDMPIAAGVLQGALQPLIERSF
ncbi:MAG TPA: bifunctional ornithine acetyltransferase/N-acetylglutamate synthase, partial [Devosia sp.]|nr:bifunctional ornithine acetyltransferase/N-acetylglutamate synthase [Devosia sp.]